MLPYWLLFIFPAWLALTRLRPEAGNVKPHARWSSQWRAVFMILVLMVGLRHEVGGDWGNYLPLITDAGDKKFVDVLKGGEPGYFLLNWLAAQTGLGIYLVNTLCALVFSWGLVVFCRAQPRPWLALTVAVPYLVTVVAMGYTRQGVAIGLAMFGLVALAERRLLHFVLLVALAATFHKSAVILMPLAALAGTKRKLWSLLWVGGASVLAYVLMLQDSVESLRTNYLETEYQSQGASIRLAMNAVPAGLFLVYRRRFVMPNELRIFWTWMSMGALVFLVLLVVSPSSTAVDRVALYWIPLQLFVLSRLPNALGAQDGRNKVWVLRVVWYSAAVLFVWLSFATHAFAWLPYQFYPLVWLFD